MERRFTSGRGITVEEREGGGPKIAGVGAVYYDGTPETEYELWPGTIERIMPGAFDRAISEGDDVRGLFNHNPDNILGRVSAGTMRLSVDRVGLHYEIEPPDTRLAADLTASIKRADITGSSFAFEVTDEEWRKEDDVEIREIHGVRLRDTGPVTYPAYEATTAKTRAMDTADAKFAHAAWREKARREAAKRRVNRVADHLSP